MTEYSWEWMDADKNSQKIQISCKDLINWRLQEKLGANSCVDLNNEQLGVHPAAMAGGINHDIYYTFESFYDFLEWLDRPND